MATGIMEIRILTTYFVPSFHLNLNKSLKSQTISFHKMTQVLSKKVSTNCKVSATANGQVFCESLDNTED